MTSRSVFKNVGTLGGLERNINFVSFHGDENLLACGGEYLGFRLAGYYLNSHLDDKGNVEIWSLEDFSLFQKWQDNSQLNLVNLAWVAPPDNRKLSFILSTRMGSIQIYSKNKHEVSIILYVYLRL